jgi:diguanylate cyclase (GGDEF)-like protein
VKARYPARAISSNRTAVGDLPHDTTDRSARLQQSRVTLAELTQALTASEQHATAAQKELETLAETNSYLRRKLLRAESKAATANRLAYHDVLTGLPNRRLLLDRLNQAIAQASRQKKRVALVFFDVDGFKVINDKLGHANGDKLLQGVAQRLCACLRTADTACRYGGDEFIVMLPEIEGEQSAAVVEQKIRAQLAAPYLVDGTLITVTLSIGTAVYPVDAKDHRDLIKLADAAMYSAKTNGGAAPSVEQPTGSAARLSVDERTGNGKAKIRFNGHGVVCAPPYLQG